MSETEQARHSIGDEIPFRRDRIEKKTGSLVFDRHLEEKLDGEPAQASSQSSPDATIR